MATQVCKKCGVEKCLETDFYALKRMANGCASKCKECAKAGFRNRYFGSREKRETAKKRTKDWITKNPERRKANLLKYKEKNLEKIKARAAVQHAVRDGKLQRQPCRDCGEKAHAHHSNYSKPLDVIWLCAEHHAQLHHRERFPKDTHDKLYQQG